MTMSALPSDDMFSLQSAGQNYGRKDGSGDAILEDAQVPAQGGEMLRPDWMDINVISGLSDALFSASNFAPYGYSDDTDVLKAPSNMCMPQIAPSIDSRGLEEESRAITNVSGQNDAWCAAKLLSIPVLRPAVDVTRSSGTNEDEMDDSKDRLLNAHSSVGTQAELGPPKYLGSPAAPGFMHVTTPSTAEPLWQRRLHARLQSSQSSNVGSGSREEQPKGTSLSSSASYLAMLAAGWEGAANDSNGYAVDQFLQTSGRDGSLSQQGSWTSFDSVSPAWMQWNAEYAASNYDEKIAEYSNQMHRHASRSRSSNDTEFSSASDNTAHSKWDSSLATSVDASPVNIVSTPCQIPDKAEQRGFIRPRQQDETGHNEVESENSCSTHVDMMKRARHGDRMLQQEKRRRFSRGGVSPKTSATRMMKGGDIPTGQEGCDLPANASGVTDRSQEQVYPALSSETKGIINKVIINSHGHNSKGINAESNATYQTELQEGEEIRHLCPHPGCDKHFSTSGHARRHSRVHASLRPFECPHDGCGATFTRRDNCTQHQRARHRSQLTARRISDDL